MRPDTTQPEDAAVLAAMRSGDAPAFAGLAERYRRQLHVRDALGWSAKEVASLLEGSVASANSALQRARSTMRTRLPERRLDWAAITEPTDDERSVLRRYMEAYLRRHGESEYRLEGLDVLRIEDGEIVEITSFTPELLPAFGLPPTLDR